MKNLKKLRTARHLSQQKLADEFQLSQQSIYKYENNLAEPDIQTLKKIASFFHTTVDYLIGYSSNDNALLENQLKPDEAHMLLLYRKLSPEIKPHVDALLEELTKGTGGKR